MELAWKFKLSPGPSVDLLATKEYSPRILKEEEKICHTKWKQIRNSSNYFLYFEEVIV
jgi:hypothetical protein